MIKTDFGESVVTNLEVETGKTEALSQQLLELSNGTIKVKQVS